MEGKSDLTGFLIVGIDRLTCYTRVHHTSQGRSSRDAEGVVLNAEECMISFGSTGSGLDTVGMGWDGMGWGDLLEIFVDNIFLCSYLTSAWAVRSPAYTV